MEHPARSCLTVQVLTCTTPACAQSHPFVRTRLWTHAMGLWAARNADGAHHSQRKIRYKNSAFLDGVLPAPSAAPLWTPNVLVPHACGVARACARATGTYRETLLQTSSGCRLILRLAAWGPVHTALSLAQRPSLAPYKPVARPACPIPWCRACRSFTVAALGFTLQR
jgi:hypothetical protein